MSRSILVVTPYLPLPADFGGALRIYHLVRELARSDEVILLAPATPGEFEQIRALGAICDVTTVPAATTARRPPGWTKRAAQLRAIPDQRSFLELSEYRPRMQAAMDRLFQTRRIDLVQYEFPQSALYRPTRPVPTVYDAHNIEHELLRRIALESTSLFRAAFNLLEYRRLHRFERRVWSEADLVVATSGIDAETIAGATGCEVPVVPNGVDLDAFRPVPNAEKRPHQIVFTGAMRHAPNAAAAVWFVEQVLPLIRRAVPDATLAIVGADPPAGVQALASPAVTVTGRVDDVQPYLAGSAVAIVPLLAGGGTRLKILEAFAMGVPVVSTSTGAEGLAGRDGEHLVIADNPAAYADAVVNVLTGQADTGTMTKRARQLVEREYGWPSVAARLREAHEIAFARFRSR